jgi:hypothetical protein
MPALQSVTDSRDRQGDSSHYKKDSKQTPDDQSRIERSGGRWRLAIRVI